jgi:hypothetical protein
VGDVSVSALGNQRFRITWPDGECEVDGFAEARSLANELAA